MWGTYVLSMMMAGWSCQILQWWLKRLMCEAQVLLHFVADAVGWIRAAWDAPLSFHLLRFSSAASLLSMQLILASSTPNWWPPGVSIWGFLLPSVLTNCLSRRGVFSADPCSVFGYSASAVPLSCFQLTQENHLWLVWYPLHRPQRSVCWNMKDSTHTEYIGLISWERLRWWRTYTYNV